MAEAEIYRFPTFTKYGPQAQLERMRLAKMFRGRSVEDMRRFWDCIGDDSFYHGSEGDFDCADIHGYMNMLGDGAYCAV